MKTFIDLEDINVLCNAPKFDNANGEAKDGFNEQWQKQGKSESQYNESSTFMGKIKNNWGKAKRFILGVVDYLNTMSSLFKAITGCAKFFGKMKRVFA